MTGTPAVPGSAEGFRGERFGSYQLLRRLGAGGMAEVFLARQVPPFSGRPVALKRMLPHLADDLAFVSRFKREAMITLQLRHPAIGRVLEVGRVGRSWFMAMELVPGETLASVFDEERTRIRRTPVAIVRRVGADIAMALDYAHKLAASDGRPLKIVHRDVSPQNVMVSYGGQIKLIDFGVARWADSGTSTDSLAGKVRYFSPEQARGLPVDHRSDVFSLGVMLYEGLLGGPVFRRGNEMATMHAILEEDPPPLEGAPADLEASLRRAMNKDPGQRFGDARELADALLGGVAGSASARLGAGPEDLVAYMAELFPVGAAGWGRVLEVPISELAFQGGQGQDEAERIAGLSETEPRTRPPCAASLSFARKTVRMLRPIASAAWRPEASREMRSSRPSMTAVTASAPSRRLLGVASVATVALFVTILRGAVGSGGNGENDVGANWEAAPWRISSGLSLGVAPLAPFPISLIATGTTRVATRGRGVNGRKEASQVAKRLPHLAGGSMSVSSRGPVRSPPTSFLSIDHARRSPVSVADQFEPSPYREESP